jgi:hypothetical protein
MHADLAEAYMEAYDRGPHWQIAIATSLDQLDPLELDEIKVGLRKGMTRLDGDPAKYGV